MKSQIGILAGLALGLLVWNGPVSAQTEPTRCPGAPEKLEGQVVKVDLQQGKLTVRAPDGTLHELGASKETLEGYKAGDHLEAKLRSVPNCK